MFIYEEEDELWYDPEEDIPFEILYPIGNIVRKEIEIIKNKLQNYKQYIQKLKPQSEDDEAFMKLQQYTQQIAEAEKELIKLEEMKVKPEKILKQIKTNELQLESGFRKITELIEEKIEEPEEIPIAIAVQTYPTDICEGELSIKCPNKNWCVKNLTHCNMTYADIETSFDYTPKNIQYF